MSRFLPVPARIGVVAALGLALVVPTAHAATPDAPAAAAPTVSVVLPTGDTVRVGHAHGRPSYAVLAADPTGIAGSFSGIDVAGDHYVIPAEARPLLGSLVDPSLFDVTSRAASRTPDTVTASVTSASAHVPGLTVTRRTATTLTGHVDAAGAAAFREALLDAAHAVAAGHAQTSFPGVTRLSGPDATPVAKPDYPQVALNLVLKGAAGERRPSGFAVLINTDDARRYNSFVFLDRGKARVSVPLGNYSALASSFSFEGRSALSLDVPIADYPVSADEQTLTFDTTTATVRPQVVLPDSPQVEETDVTWVRTDATGNGSTTVGDGGEGVALRWAPTPPPVYGTQAWETFFHAVGDTDPLSTYDLAYRDEGAVPSSGRHVESTDSLARIDASYYEDERTQSAFGRGPFFPGDFFVFYTLYPFRAPALVTQYVNDDDDVAWTESLIGKTRVPRSFGGDLVDRADLATYRAGERTSVDWLRGPLAPAPFEDGPGAPTSCAVCRTDNRMQIALSPYTDTVPGHIGELNDTPSGKPGIRTVLIADGKRIAGGGDRTYLLTTVPAQSRRYVLQVSADRSGDGAVLSTSSQTTYGFTSGATTGGSVPPGGTCEIGRGTADGSCRTLGLLRVTAPLPTDLYRRVPVGRSTFTMTVAPYGASAQRITSASVGLSLDGSSFTAARVVRVGAQQFRVTLDSPASWAGQPVTMRVQAADAAGDTITQTTTAAYAVAEK